MYENVLPIREFLLVCLVSAAVTFLLTGPVRRFAIRIGAVAHPRKRDVHATPMPRLGGLAMYGGLVAGVFLAWKLPVLGRSFLPTDVYAAVVAGGLIVLIGVLDDRFELDSITKLAGQATAAGLLVLFGVQWFMVWVPWGGGADSTGSILLLSGNQGAIITVLLVLTMVNAMNFVDGLDGLAAGIGLIASMATLAFTINVLYENNFDAQAFPPALLAAALGGACLGFLPYNFQPAKLFMGDSGSMLIGLMLATSTTSAAGKLNPSTVGGDDVVALLAPLVVVAAVMFVPLLDLLMAVVRRTKQGRSPFHADKMHLHHRLLEIGHSHRRAVLLIYVWAGVLAFGAVALTMFNAYRVMVTFGLAILLALLATIIPRLRAR